MDPTFAYKTRTGKVIEVKTAPVSRTKATLMRAAGAGLILCSWIPAALFRLETRDAMATVFLVAGSAIPIMRKAGRYSTTPADAALQGSRPPILYLRSFLDDARDVEQASGARSFDESDLRTAEEAMLSAFGSQGPCVAIGRPGEPLPPLGACRIYVEDAHWREVVLDLLHRSQLVILRMGSTRGLQWELETTVLEVAPEKVILFLPALRGPLAVDHERHYGEFRAWAMPFMPNGLPDCIGEASMIVLGSDWVPHRVEPGAELARDLAGHPLAKSIAEVAKHEVYGASSFTKVTSLMGTLSRGFWVVYLGLTTVLFVAMLGWGGVPLALFLAVTVWLGRVLHRFNRRRERL